MAPDAMKVGELADRTGLSVRTLHHYDDIGLLSPAERTPAGHRIYGLAEVRRLQQIASLRHLGLSLEEIRHCLENPGYSLDRVLEMQIERMREEVVRQRRLIGLLELLRTRVSGSETLSIDDVTRTIEGTLRHERYYTPDQRQQIARHAEALGEERIAQGQRDWAGLFQDFEQAMDDGLDPASDEVRALAQRAEALIGQFTGGDPGIRASLARMYEEEGGEKLVRGQGMPMREGVWEYYSRAMAARARASADGP